MHSHFNITVLPADPRGQNLSKNKSANILDKQIKKKKKKEKEKRNYSTITLKYKLLTFDSFPVFCRYDPGGKQFFGKSAFSVRAANKWNSISSHIRGM